MSLFHLEEDRQTFIHSPYHEQLIRERYEKMNQMLTAVEHGDAERAMSLLASGLDSVHEVNRLYTPEEETLKQAHNWLVSLNVILMTCAWRAHVSPLFLHSLSRRYDKKIEQVTTVPQSDALTREMIEQYCELVHLANTDEHYGSFSDKAIHILTSHLTEPMNLKQLAADMGVAPATLSRRFKAETGQTLTYYLNRSRIRLAQLYLQESTMNLTQIAQTLGFSDASYFSKVFLRHTGTQPSEYARRIKLPSASGEDCVPPRYKPGAAFRPHPV